MKHKLSLVNKMKIASGFFKNKDLGKYIKTVKSELDELAVEVENKDRAGIEDELGDVLFQTIMMYEKAVEEYGVSPTQMYRNVIEKYKVRAPHILKEKFIGLDAENNYWFKHK